MLLLGSHATMNSTLLVALVRLLGFAMYFHHGGLG